MLALARGLAAAALALLGIHAGAQTTTLVSESSNGGQGNSSSGRARTSASGRFVVFSSTSTNFCRLDSNGESDVFLRDMEEGTVELVSATPAGYPGNGGSGYPVVSASGRYVAFTSGATDFVPWDANGYIGDVLVRDRFTGTTELASVGATGAQGTTTAVWPSICSSGRLVTFCSYDALVDGDVNAACDVFVRDLDNLMTECVSVSSTGVLGAGNSRYGVISGDGRFVAFQSHSDNLVPNDTNAASDVFVHDRQHAWTERVSIDSFGAEGNADSAVDDRQIAISEEGRIVAFVSDALNLVPDGTTWGGNVFVHDRLGGTTELISKSTTGAIGSGSGVSISADGRYVTFLSNSANLVPSDMNGHQDVFLRDRQLGTTSLISLNNSGAQSIDDCWWPSISANGNRIVFQTAAENMVVPDTNGAMADVFLRDWISPPPTPRVSDQARLGGGHLHP